MVRRAAKRRRVKVSATIDPRLLGAVDDFVAAHDGFDRSTALDEALRLWCAREQERAMEAQFAGPPSPEEEERAAWRRIQAAAAGHIFGR